MLRISSMNFVSKKAMAGKGKGKGRGRMEKMSENEIENDR